MSRSYKHTPRCGETKHRWAKRYANRSFRRKRLDIVLSPGQHKRYYCSYDICDYEWVGVTFERHYRDAVRSWHRWNYLNEPYPDRSEEYQSYRKWYIRK